RAQGAHAAAIINGFRERVSRKDRQAVGIPPRDFECQRMIIGETRVDHSLDQAKLGERPALRQRLRTENRLVRQVAEALKAMALAAEVTHLQSRGLRELPLDIR